MCTVLMAAVWALGAYLIHQDHKRTQQEAMHRVSGAAEVYEAFVDRHLAQVKLMLTLLAEHKSPAELQRELELLAPKGAFVDAGVRSLYVTDATGELIASSAQLASGEGSSAVTDRPYFQAHRDNPTQGLYVGAPIIGRYSKEWRVHVSSARRDSVGRFAGVAVAAIDPKDFTSFFAEDHLGRSGVLGVTGRDWVARAWRKGDVFDFGRSVQGSKLARHALLKDSGAYETESAIDGVPRYVAFKTNRLTGLIVTAALDRNEALSPFYARRTAVLMAFGLASVLLLIAFIPVLLTARQLDVSCRAAARSSELFAAASNAQLDAFFIFEACRGEAGELTDFVCQHANQRGVRWLERNGLNMLDRTLTEVLGARGASPWISAFCRVVTNHKSQVSEFELGTAQDGSIRVTRHIVPVGDGVAVNLRDVTAAYRQKAALAASNEIIAANERLLRGLTETVPILLAHFDKNLVLTFANGTCVRWLGSDWVRAEGKHVREIWGEELYASRVQYLDKALGGELVEFVSEREIANGTRVFKNNYVPDVDETGQVDGIYAVSVDVTELKRTEEKLAAMAHTDSLTGLYNRRYFSDRIPEMLSRARRNERGIGILFADVDRFKGVNDQYGHAVGDAILMEVAKRLQACVRRHDTVVRFAGDEFVVVLEDLASDETLTLVARKIVGLMGEPIAVSEQQSIQVTVSIGVSFDRRAECTAEALLAEADGALYVVKTKGRNGYEIALPRSAA